MKLSLLGCTCPLDIYLADRTPAAAIAACPFHSTFPTNLTVSRYYLAPGTPIARLKETSWEPFIAQKRAWYHCDEVLGQENGSPYSYIRLPSQAKPFRAIAVITVCFFFYNAATKSWWVPIIGDKLYQRKMLNEICVAIEKNFFKAGAACL